MVVLAAGWLSESPLLVQGHVMSLFVVGEDLISGVIQNYMYSSIPAHSFDSNSLLVGATVTLLPGDLSNFPPPA